MDPVEIVKAKLGPVGLSGFMQGIRVLEADGFRIVHPDGVTKEMETKAASMIDRLKNARTVIRSALAVAPTIGDAK